MAASGFDPRRIDSLRFKMGYIKLSFQNLSAYAGRVF